MTRFEKTFGGGSLRSDLLDELTLLAKCEFLSNLPQCKYRPALHRALLEILPEAYTLKAWQNAVAYICGNNRQFDTVHAAWQALLDATAQCPP